MKVNFLKKVDIIIENLLQSLKDAEQMIWTLLSEGTVNKKSNFHYPTLGTTNNNKTYLRTIIIRKVEKNNRTVVFYTDTRSKKFSDISNNNNVTFHIYDAKKKMQVQCYGKAITLKNNKDTKLIWNSLSNYSKKNYSSSLVPGKKISHISEASKLVKEEAGFLNFGLIKFFINKIEYLQLKKTNNIRVMFSYKGKETIVKLLAP